MRIAVDKNQVQAGSHYKSNFRNHRAMEKMGHELVITVLPYGDYCEVTDKISDIISRRGNKLKKLDFAGAIKVSVDRKGSISEIAGNLCSSSREHERFHNEYALAQQCGCKFYILIEDDAVTSLDELEKWENPRAKRYYQLKAYQAKGGKLKRQLPKQPPVSGKRLASSLRTVEREYGAKVVFCKPEDAAQRIVEILKGGNE